MDGHAPTIAAAVLGAGLALVAFVARLSRRVGDRTVDGLYYASYACTAVSALLFILRGLRTASVVLVAVALTCSWAGAGDGAGDPRTRGYELPAPSPDAPAPEPAVASAAKTGVTVVVIAAERDTVGAALYTAARALAGDVRWHRPDDAAGLPASVAAMARAAARDGRAVAVACTAARCSLPLHDPSAVARAVEALR